jgi:NDP-sugar pyrophosphorylase family protein
VIIAGGRGVRLGTLTNKKPKALVEVGGKPILYWTMNWLKRYGIQHVVLGAAYKKEKIYEFVKNNDLGLDIDISEHTLEGGTAQAFKRAIKRYVKDKEFLAMNGDELTNVNLHNMLKFHRSRKHLVTMALTPFLCRFSVVKVNPTSNITGFEYGKRLGSAPVSIGVYIFNKGIIKHIPDKGSIEDTTFSKLAKKGVMSGYILSDNEKWMSINTPKDVEEAEKTHVKWIRKLPA